MRIVYLGNNDRGVVCLHALLAAGHHIAGVVVRPDPREKPWYGSVKEAALAAGLPVIQPRRIADELATLRRWAPELLVLSGYTQIIPREVIDVAPMGAINLHGGKLPEYRGGSVMNWQIIHGETEAGVCVIRVDEGLDTGDILAQERFPLGPDDTIRDLLDRTLGFFPRMLVDVVAGLEAGTLKGVPQDVNAGRTWKKRRPEDGLITWEKMDARAVHNMVRALTRPLPGAFCHSGGSKVFVWKSRLPQAQRHGTPGEVLACEGREIFVACRKGMVALSDLTDEAGEPVTSF